MRKVAEIPKPRGRGRRALEFELELASEDAGERRIVDKHHPGLKGFAIKRATG